MALTQEQRDATECALQAARHVGLYSGWQISPDDFRARPCKDLFDACGEPCPQDENYDTPVLTAFCERMRACLVARYPDPVIPVSYMCRKFNGQLPTWGVWCDYVAQSLGVPL